MVNPGTIFIDEEDQFLSHLHDGELISKTEVTIKNFLSHLHDGERIESLQPHIANFLSHLHDGEQ